MSGDSGVLDAIERQRVVPVLRSRDADDAIATGRACIRAGMSVIELTYSIPEVERALVALARDEGIVVGIGTVTEPSQVEASVERGARFIVSYGFDQAVMTSAVKLGVAAIPGALTPSEVAGCRQAGAAAVKLFPARLLEPAYLQDLAAVMPGLKIVVTGGIAATREGIRPWLEAGALAVGVGSALGSAATEGVDEVERRCRELLRIEPPREEA